MTTESGLAACSASVSHVDGPLHLIAVEGAIVLQTGATWPLAWPITDIVMTREEFGVLEPYQNTLITDPNDAAALRAIWDEWLSGVHGTFWKAAMFIPFGDLPPGQPYSVQMRDALPMEDAMGYITPFP